ncbi:hypothetical protein SAMN06298216_2807 [Spirosomataceae bacterium TFI 002]|nr:hypothetical protein SAMN06298216_2807 [Spirosomataceae bacterium TFI 002]
MKILNNKYFFFILLFASSMAFEACEKDDNISGGIPEITYIRVTDPLSSDSLIVSAGQGSLIAIVGKNLAGANQIWFNDQQASLTPTYISNNSILVTVPTQIPKEINNVMTINFVNGQTLKHDFLVDISKPHIEGMNCEFVATGNVATIRGDYFYPPLSVTFAGGVDAEIVDVTDKILQVRVPEGAKPGSIVVKTNFGEETSNFFFRDDRNIVLSSDPFSGWWNQALVVTEPGNDAPPKINGNYIRVNEKISGWQWKEVAGGPASAMGNISKNIPDDAILNPQNYNLKFELNTKKPYNNNMIKFNFGLNSENNNAYLWKPPYDTRGEWQTITIPFDELAKSYEEAGSKMTVNPDGYWTRILFHGAGDLDCDISFDNFRIVPKEIKK